MRQTTIVLTASIALLGACGEPNHAKDLEPPPSAGPSEGPGSGDVLEAILFYHHQRNNPTVHMKSASCADVPVNAQVGTEVPCTITYAEDEGPPSQLMLELDANNQWQIRDR